MVNIASTPSRISEGKPPLSGVGGTLTGKPADNAVNNKVPSASIAPGLNRTATLPVGGHPLLQGIAGHRFGVHMYSMKSWSDEINCYSSCLVYGVHTSTIPDEDYSFDYPYGHYQLLWLTAADQVSLLNEMPAGGRPRPPAPGFPAALSRPLNALAQEYGQVVA